MGTDNKERWNCVGIGESGVSGYQKPTLLNAVKGLEDDDDDGCYKKSKFVFFKFRYHSVSGRLPALGNSSLSSHFNGYSIYLSGNQRSDAKMLVGRSKRTTRFQCP